MKEEKVNCIIIDDEFLARRLLSDYIKKIPELNLVGSFDSPLAISNVINENNVELIFTDIEMDDILGIDFIENLRVPNPPLVIFVSAYSEYAAKAFEIDAMEYLVKPVTFPRFLKASNKALNIIDIKRKMKNNNLETGNISERRAVRDNFIIVKIDRKHVKIQFDDILYIEGALEYVYFQTKTNRLMSLFSLKKLENTLPNDKFMRIHKSYIVAIDKIDMVDGNKVILGDNEIAVSRTFKKRLLEKLS
ncbi:MAG: LytTR family DNA-binding domain-containing protein [Marinifilaceae bacterium]|jgi:DNA-binding LytR/AlgR family response regulator|nr:LytTR family DNA-binding domain-containing protein [Marinifilaceae bacterium]